MALGAGDKYLHELEVQYTDQNRPPPNSLTELNTNISDINYGFGGQFVWLIPRHTSNPTDACTYIAIHISTQALPDTPDLAAWAGGEYRHLLFTRDVNARLRIQEVALYRKTKGGPMNETDLKILEGRGYSRDHSGDINRNRNGDYLYLVWKQTQ